MKKITIAVVFFTLFSVMFFSKAFTKNQDVSVVFTGDNLLGSKTVINSIQKNGYDAPYSQVKNILYNADITFGNLENPLTNYPNRTLGKSAESINHGRNFVFKAPPEYGKILKDTGFDIMTLGNNHAMDYQVQGMNDTLDILDKFGIKYIGAGRNLDDAVKPKIIEKNGVKFGFIGYSMIVPALSSASKNSAGANTHTKAYSQVMEKAIKDLKKKTDFVIITFHWGIEGQYYPTAYQKQIAKKCIDAGADAVIGHHPHRIQGVEVYKGKIIAYSLGNFLFKGKSNGVESMILQINFSKDRILSAGVYPIWVKVGQPIPLKSPSLINKIVGISKGFGTTFEKVDNGDFLKITNLK